MHPEDLEYPMQFFPRGLCPICANPMIATQSEFIIYKLDDNGTPVKNVVSTVSTIVCTKCHRQIPAFFDSNTMKFYPDHPVLHSLVKENAKGDYPKIHYDESVLVEK